MVKTIRGAVCSGFPITKLREFSAVPAICWQHMGQVMEARRSAPGERGRRRT